MTDDPVIRLEPFQPGDQEPAKRLILAGLEQHWGVLDLSMNPDLDDIAASYAGAIFLGARQAGRIVGTGALVPRPDGVAEIVRMSVDRQLRRQGLGRMILSELHRRATRMGFRRIVLETTEAWQEVVAFYLDYGFHITHRQDGDVYFALDLAEEPG